MPPLMRTPPLSRRWSERSEMAQIGSMEQAGRSETALQAEVSGAALRSVASVPAMRLERSAPGVPPPNFNIPPLVETPHEVSNQRASYAPIAPSPLDPSSSQSSVSRTEDGPFNMEVTPVDTSSSGTGEISSTGPNSVRSTSKPRRAGTGMLSTPQMLLRNKSATSIASGEIGGPRLPRTEAPRMLQNLGGDYSRYPRSLSNSNSRESSHSPGSRSRRNLNAPLLRTTTQNPFSDSQADLERWGYPDDSIGAFDPYFGGGKGFILYSNEIEADDKIHQPQADDDIAYKPKMSEHFDRRLIVSTVGGVFLVLGLLCVFIVLPVLTYSTRIFLPYSGSAGTGPAWAHVNDRTYPLMKNVRKNLIDPDTPVSAMTRKSAFDGSTLKLVFSDEFNDDNRTFYSGDDPYWTGADLWYGATQDLEWYDPDAITTGGGTLQLKLDAFPNHNLQYRSGMLQSWNQLCFKGGVFEISASLAGPSGVPGLWPGAWTMGNLGRPGYKATTEGVWPYTYNECDYGITPNQSAPDGLSYLPGQKLSACTCKGSDHPNPGTGRGAPEIDILEGSVDPTDRIGVVTQSAQVAPFDVFWRPNSDFMAIPNYETTQMNGYTGGPFQQAISGTTLLNNEWYDGNAYQKYAFEYIPGTSKGKIAWFVGENPSFIMDGRAIGPNGNVGARQVSEEPMSMILNLGISGAWGEILFGDLKFPTVMHIDYVRLYQPKGNVSVTCDPEGYPTTKYIKEHLRAYDNANLTSWDDTGYGWPKHTFTGC